jgi:hypothetical protein
MVSLFLSSSLHPKFVQIEGDGGYEMSNGKPFSTLISYLLVFHTTNAQRLEKTFHFSCDN